MNIFKSVLLIVFFLGIQEGYSQFTVDAQLRPRFEYIRTGMNLVQASYFLITVYNI